MKITKIELTDYNQFKNVEIDLTYPKGHEKEGKPLDKVCFIGRSGSGKTSLLRLIKWFVSLKRDIGKNIELPIPPENALKMDVQFFDLAYRMVNTEDVPYIQYTWDNNMDSDRFFQLLDGYFRKVNPLLINFPTEILTAGNDSEADETDALDELERIRKSRPYPGKAGSRLTIDFAFEDVSKNWDYILNDIREHRALEILMKKKIGDVELQEYPSPAEKSKEKKKRTDEYKKWAVKNPDPLKALADGYLDEALYNLGLKTKTDIDLETISNLGFIQLQTLTGRDVPRVFWSTGTRQLVQTVIPLYQLKPQNAIILVDEPERSLYPDIQKSIIDTYIKLAPDCQFFFATHSALIASSFEPWEIVELKFDENHNYVYRDLHYEGQNHVDNYKFFPEYLRWDSILERIFDLEEEGGKRRLRALERLAEIDIRIRKLKDKGKLDSPEGKKFAAEFKELSQKVDWEF